MSCLSSSHCSPKGMNIKTDEFAALSDMLGDVKFELGLEEYKNDLAQPGFIGANSVPAPFPIAQGPKEPDLNGPCTDVQWKKCSKLAAWLGCNL